MYMRCFEPTSDLGSVISTANRRRGWDPPRVPIHCAPLHEASPIASANDIPVAEARADAWRAQIFRPQPGHLLQLWNVKGLEYNRVEFQLADISPPLAGTRILHVSDLHLRSHWPGGLDDLLQRAQQRSPHIVLFGGDLAQHMHHLQPALPHIQRLVTCIRGSCATLAVLGNHDGDLLEPHLVDWGVNVITTRAIDVSVNGAALEIIGFPGVERLDVDEAYIRSISPRRAGVGRIILSHYPDLIRCADPIGADLFLAGHTHGGQICLPRGIPIIRHDSLRRKFCHGIHRYKNTCIIVNRGIGFSSPLQMRAFCPSEVIEITLAPLP
jgi:predicted MPP superfamily phosphohydrolase